MFVFGYIYICTIYNILNARWWESAHRTHIQSHIHIYHTIDEAQLGCCAHFILNESRWMAIAIGVNHSVVLSCNWPMAGRGCSLFHHYRRGCSKRIHCYSRDVTPPTKTHIQRARGNRWESIRHSENKTINCFCVAWKIVINLRWPISLSPSPRATRTNQQQIHGWWMWTAAAFECWMAWPRRHTYSMLYAHNNTIWTQCVDAWAHTHTHTHPIHVHYYARQRTATGWPFSDDDKQHSLCGAQALSFRACVVSIHLAHTLTFDTIQFILALNKRAYAAWYNVVWWCGGQTHHQKHHVYLALDIFVFYLVFTLFSGNE